MLSYLFSFYGRSGRMAFWANGLVYIPVYLAILLLVELAGVESLHLDDFTSVQAWPLVVAIALLFVASITSAAVAVRRLHDRGKPGFWLLLFWGPGILYLWVPEIGLPAAIAAVWYYVELGFLPGVEGARDFERREARATTELPPVMARLEHRPADGFGRRSV